MLKQLDCLEACKELHKLGSLMDNLVLDVVEEADGVEMGLLDYVDEHDTYVPSELVSKGLDDSTKTYYCYLLELDRSFTYDISLHNLVLAVSNELDLEEDRMDIKMEVDRGILTVHMRYLGTISLTSEQVLMCQQFQVKIFRVLYNLKKTLDVFHPWKDLTVFDYLLLPSTGSQGLIDWLCVGSILFKGENICHDHAKCPFPKNQYNFVHTKNGLICRCILQDSLVVTPHNGYIYCVMGTLDGVDGNSVLDKKRGESMTYKNFYEKRRGIKLHFEWEHFLRGRRVSERSNAFVELPPELCDVILSPISVATCYSFSFAPSIMHQIESFLIASSLKKMHAHYCQQNSIATTKIPTVKVLEAITTKECQEKFHLESLETLGDSFLKYAACQHLFKKYQNEDEGDLSVRKDKLISNPTLCKLGCSRKIPGFIRNEPFKPKTWIIPGDQLEAFHEVQLSAATKVYSKGKRKMKSKVVADVVEALIGAFLCTGGEVAALSIINWLGIEIEFSNIPYERSFPAEPDMLVNISCLESLLNYKFSDPSLILEELTHGSFKRPQNFQCYQRLEFLGDSVFDYLITVHLYDKYPGLSPGLLTDLRSASVNNDCYALSAIKFGLQKHILHASQELHRHIVEFAQHSNQLSLGSTFGWESEMSIPKVLADLIESLAGAIFVDSCYDKDVVFKSIRPLLEPLVSPQTLKLHPVRELHELCQKQHYVLKKPAVSCENGVASVTVEVEAAGVIHKKPGTASNKVEAKKLASKAVLKSLKQSMSTEPHPTPFLSSPKGKKGEEEN